MSSILFKLKQRVSTKSKLEVLQAIQVQFQAHPEQAFPGTDAVDLANIFSLTVPDSEELQVLQTLSGLIAVEYAESESKRYLHGAVP